MDTALPYAIWHLAMMGIVASALAGSATAADMQGSVEHGAKVFRACTSCHSLEPGRHLTGPSLAGVIGRKAGTAKGFKRYSEALLNADVVWNERTLDQWIANPAKMIPDNTMAFPGIPDARARSDLIAYLKAVSAGDAAAPKARMPNLKNVKAEDAVARIRYCGDTYTVTMKSGETYKIWEFNLRLKTDSSEFGPRPGQPVLIGVGMRGDRAAIVFSTPDEIARLIEPQC